MKNQHFQKLIFIIGLLIITASIFLNPYTFKFFLEKDLISRESTIVNILLEFFLFIIGIIFVLYYSDLKKTLYATLYFFFLIFITEIFLMLGYYFIDKKNDISISSVNTEGDELWDNLNGSFEHDYHSFLHSFRKEYRTKHVNVVKNNQFDQIPIRKTWHPNTLTDYPKNIYIFGGSTIWGWGVKDDSTIPSFISKNLNKEKFKYKVTNLGQSSYSFLQEVIYLSLLLRDGHRPDYVIFYDGVNEVYNAGMNNLPGATYSYKKMIDLLQPVNGIHTKYLVPIISTVRASKIFKFILLVINHNNDINHSEVYLKKTTDIFSDDFSDNVVSHYEKTVNFLDHLSLSFDFKYILFWQPVIYSKKKLNNEESQILEKWNLNPYSSRMEYLYKSVYYKISSKKISNFINISSIFDEYDNNHYIDFCHLNEIGNKVVAEKIAFEIKRL